MANKNIICFDLETTGVQQYTDEILQCSIVDGDFNVLFSDYCKPLNHTEWPQAQAKNNISPSMVMNKPTIQERKQEIIDIFNKADIIVTYNGEHFDIPMIQRILDFKIKGKSFDVMKHFIHEFALYDHSQNMFKLDNVCKCFGIVNEKAHDALEDVKATLKCFYKMVEEGKKPNLYTIYKFDDGKEIYTESLALEYKNKSGHKVVDTIYLGKDGIIDKSQVGDKSQYRVGEFIKERELI